MLTNTSSENGIVCSDENNLTREQAVQDDFRINYLESYADVIAKKIAEGIPIKSYLMWAWTDNFECEPLLPGVVPVCTQADMRLQGKKGILRGSESFGSIIKMDVSGILRNRRGI